MVQEKGGWYEKGWLRVREGEEGGLGRNPEGYCCLVRVGDAVEYGIC